MRLDDERVGTGEGPERALALARALARLAQPPWLTADTPNMTALDHHKLDVYHRALSLLEVCDRIVEKLPPGRSHVRGQIDRAASSVVANIAEGAGEFRSKEKARFYRMARRSATETAAWFDIIEMRKEAPEGALQSANQHVEDVVAMLVKLIRSCER